MTDKASTPQTETPVLPKRFLGRTTLSIEETAEVIGVSRGSAYEAAKKGSIPSIRIGRRLLVPRAALEKLLAG